MSVISNVCSIFAYHTIHTVLCLRVWHKLFTSFTNCVCAENMEGKQEKTSNEEEEKNLKQQRTVQFPLRLFRSVWRIRKCTCTHRRHDLCVFYILHFHFQNLAFHRVFITPVFLLSLSLCNVTIWVMGLTYNNNTHPFSHLLIRLNLHSCKHIYIYICACTYVIHMMLPISILFLRLWNGKHYTHNI